MDYQHHSSTRSRPTTHSSPDNHVTRVKQSIDDLQVLIQSSNHAYHTQRYRPIETSNKKTPISTYHIRIDDFNTHSSLDFNISLDAAQNYSHQRKMQNSDLNTTRYQTARAQQSEFQSIRKVDQKQQKRFGELSHNYQSANNFENRKPIVKKKIQPLRFQEQQTTPIYSPGNRSPSHTSNQQSQVQTPKHTSPSVFNYAAEDSILSEHNQVQPLQIQKEESIGVQHAIPFSLQKNAEEMIKEDPPSMKDIPTSLYKTQPIIVPISSIPKNALNYTSKNSNSKYHSFSGGEKSPKVVQIGLRSPSKTKQPQDRFMKEKNRYMDRLAKQSKTRLQESRTMSKKKRSLSPSCQQITNRLHYTKTNGQPCAKYQHYNAVLQRMRMKETLKDYTFVRRYLSDTQICQIFQDLQREGVAQYKWAMKVVDVVYSKLHSFRMY